MASAMACYHVSSDSQSIGRKMSYFNLYSLCADKPESRKDQYQLVTEASKLDIFKSKLKYIIRKSIHFASFEESIHRINVLLEGWINYFKPASVQGNLKNLEELVRNRLWGKT